MSTVIDQVKQNREQMVAGTGVFSRQRFNDFVDGFINDKDLQIDRPRTMKGENSTINPSEVFRTNLRKTIEGAGVPSKTELSVLETAKIKTTNTGELILAMLGQYISKGNPVEIPLADGLNVKIKTRAVPAGQKVSTVRDMKTQELRGTSITTFEDHHQVSAKNSVPDKYKSKVFKDLDGNVVVRNKK